MRAEMTLRTSYGCMLSIQGKRKGIVVEIISKAVQAIMTVKAGIPESDHMVDHERGVDLPVTTLTGPLLENGNIGTMTIPTLERFLRSRKRMAFQ